MENFRPTLFWAWNSEMTENEIVSCVKDFSDAKIGGVYLHARAGLKIKYLGDEWMKACELTIRECKKYNIDVWIYDEESWPSGFAGGIVNDFGEDYQLKNLEKTDSYSDEIKEKILVAYKFIDGIRTVVDKNDKTADEYIYYIVTAHYVDLLNENVTKEFINCTHEVYKKRFGNEFGKTIKGVFTDEPQIHVSSRAWSVALPKAFKEEYNEEIYDNLYLLFESEGDSYQEFRYKYYDVVRKLFVNNYSKKIFNWCQDNNLICTGHFAGEEGLCVQVASNTGVMPHYEYFDQIGIDYLGRRLNPVLLLKQAQSVAHQFGRKRIMSEIYACTGNGVSFKELAWIWLHQVGFGVNVPCMSIAMTTLQGVRKRDYPIFVSSQQNWWKEFEHFSTFMENASKNMYEGEFNPDTLVISAMNSVLKEPLFSDTQKIISSNYRKLIENLTSLQIKFDIADEILLEKYGEVKGTTIKIKNGEYNTVILPEIDNISISTLELLENYVSNGGNIIYIQSLPRLFDGKINDQAYERLKKICNGKMLQERKGILKKYFILQNYQREIAVYDYFGRLEEELMINYKINGDEINSLIFNPSTSSKKDVVVKALGSGAFYKINLMDNTREPLQGMSNDDETFVKIVINEMEGCFITFIKNATCQNAKKITTKKDYLLKTPKLQDNVLAIDYATFKINGGDDSKKLPLVKVLDEIYKEAEKHKGSCVVEIKYEFEADYLADKMYFAAETEKATKIIVNGKEIDKHTEEFYLDKSFKKYDLQDNLQIGNNEIILQFEIKALNLGFDINEVHDSVRNRFSYPVETETIFIIGDFDVEVIGNIHHKINNISVDGIFKIVKPKEFDNFELTSSGKWFSTSNAIYKLEIEVENSKQVLLNIPKYFGTAVNVKVNDKDVGILNLFDNNIDITNNIKVGKNILELELLNNLRNILGPHHHFNGEVEFTGVHTFTGQYGNGAIEDLSSVEMPDNVWTDKYSFIRFGIEKIEIIEIN